MSTRVCRACGSEQVEPGQLYDAAMWLDAQSVWSKTFHKIEVKLLACLDCGQLDLYADPVKLRKVLET